MLNPWTIRSSTWGDPPFPDNDVMFNLTNNSPPCNNTWLVDVWAFMTGSFTQLAVVVVNVVLGNTAFRSS